jgi:hypothetical protein
MEIDSWESTWSSVCFSFTVQTAVVMLCIDPKSPDQCYWK